MNQNNENNITLNEKAVQIVLLIVLCLMSLQPLVGITTRFTPNSAEELMSMIFNFFLRKSELIRFNGYVALVIAILVALLSERVSITEFFKKIYAKKPWNICFSLLFIWVIVNACTVAPYKEIALNGDAYRFEGLFSVVAYAGFFACASLLKEGKYKKIWMNVTIAASTVLGICSVHSLYAENPLVLTYMNRQIVGVEGSGGLIATFPQFNHYAYYLCVVLLLIAGLMLQETKKANRIIYMLLLAFHQYLLALNGTRGSMIAAIVALVLLSVFVLVRKDANTKMIIMMWMLVVIGSIPAMGSIVSRVNYTAEEVTQIVTKTEPVAAPKPSGRKRLELWTNCIELIKMYPIKGFGLNMSSYALTQLRNLRDMPHNEYLQHFVDLGLIGFSLYVGALLSMFASAMKRLKELPFMVVVAGGGVIAYAVSAFFGVTIVEVLPFFYILLGFAKWEKPVMEEETRSEENENI